MGVYRVAAYNTATQAENKIHDDSVATSLGFGGGLVPGVDVYAYLTRAAVEPWGRDWLERGAVTARFRRPVYDGEEVTISTAIDGPDRVDAHASTARIERCATATFELPDVVSHPAGDIGAAPIPTDPPLASVSTLAPGTVLGTLSFDFRAAKATGYLADVRESLSIYADQATCHPGYLLRWANWSLSFSVRLGPWIHTASAVQHLAAVTDGDRVEIRGRVADNFEEKGHKYVSLDVLYLVDDEPVMVVDHRAIWEPRPGR